MKVIVTGGTGLIGGAALRRLLTLPTVTSVVALSRREIPINDAKLHTIIVKDFTKYDDDLLEQLAGAEACVWAFGSPSSGKDIHVDCVYAAATAFAEKLIPKLPEGSSAFRFISISGGAVVADQSKTVWIMGDIRKSRGAVENRLCGEYVEKYAPKWQTFIPRPNLVTKGKPLHTMVMSNSWFIPVDDLGAAVAELAVKGEWEGGRQRLTNLELRKLGEQALKA